MVPVLSTRLFGRLPGAAELRLARQAGFVDFELFLDQLPGLDEARALKLLREANEQGLHIPCVHLPTHAAAGAPIGTPLAGSEELSTWRRALALAHRLGSRYAICHMGTRQPDVAERLCEAAHEQNIALCFEADTVPTSSLGELLRLLRALGPAARGHGLCLDLSRTHIDREMLAEVGRCLLWLEVSAHRGETLHLVPHADDSELRERVEACSRLPYVAYEVVPAGPPGAPAGAAQLTVLLRQLHLFHTGGGTPKYEGISPFIPAG